MKKNILLIFDKDRDAFTFFRHNERKLYKYDEFARQEKLTGKKIEVTFANIQKGLKNARVDQEKIPMLYCWTSLRIKKNLKRTRDKVLEMQKRI